MSKKIEAILIHIIIYGTATGLSCLVFNYGMNNFNSYSYFIKLFLSNLIGCFVIFLNCIIFDTLSINDPNWTIQSSVYSIYYFLQGQKFNYRSILVLSLVNLWSARLTFNLFTTAVHHIKDEDWRYTDLRAKFKPKFVFFIVGFFGILFMPYIVTFFSCMPMYHIFKSDKELNCIDLIGFIVLVSGIIIEAISDFQLSVEFKMAEKQNRVRFMDKGLWSQCRHPNYCGEILFWFGLYIVGIASGISLIEPLNIASLIIGPFGVFFLIYFLSLPLMEEKQLLRKKDLYANYVQRVPFKILPINFIFKKHHYKNIKIIKNNLINKKN